MSCWKSVLVQVTWQRLYWREAKRLSQLKSIREWSPRSASVSTSLAISTNSNWSKEMQSRLSCHFSISVSPTLLIRSRLLWYSSSSSIDPCSDVPYWCSSVNSQWDSWLSQGATCTAGWVWTCSCSQELTTCWRCLRTVSSRPQKSSQVLSELNPSTLLLQSTSLSGMVSFVSVSCEKTKLCLASSAWSKF